MKTRCLPLSAVLVLNAASHAGTLDMLGMGVLRGDLGSVARAVNSKGWLGGYSSGFETGPSHAVVWSLSGGLRDLGHLPGEPEAETRGLNDAGEAVGSSGFKAFAVLPGGAMLELPLPPGRAAGFANSVNNSGWACGVATNRSFQLPRPVLWDPELAYHILPTLPGGNEGSARHVSESRLVAGYSESFNGRRAVVWNEDGVPLDLGVLAGCATSEANWVLDSGLAVGLCDGPQGRRPFLYDRVLGIRALALPRGAVEAWANAVSPSGLVVGACRLSNGRQCAALWRNGTARLLNDEAPKMRVSFNVFDALGVNGSDQIAASWVRAGVRTRGFLGRVVP